MPRTTTATSNAELATASSKLVESSQVVPTTLIEPLQTTVPPAVVPLPSTTTLALPPTTIATPSMQIVTIIRSITSLIPDTTTFAPLPITSAILTSEIIVNAPSTQTIPMQPVEATTTSAAADPITTPLSSDSVYAPGLSAAEAPSTPHERVGSGLIAGVTMAILIFIFVALFALPKLKPLFTKSFWIRKSPNWKAERIESFFAGDASPKGRESTWTDLGTWKRKPPAKSGDVESRYSGNEEEQARTGKSLSTITSMTCVRKLSYEPPPLPPSYSRAALPSVIFREDQARMAAAKFGSPRM